MANKSERFYDSNFFLEKTIIKSIFVAFRIVVGLYLVLKLSLPLIKALGVIWKGIPIEAIELFISNFENYINNSYLYLMGVGSAMWTYYSDLSEYITVIDEMNDKINSKDDVISKNISDINELNGSLNESKIDLKGKMKQLEVSDKLIDSLIDEKNKIERKHYLWNWILLTLGTASCVGIVYLVYVSGATGGGFSKDDRDVMKGMFSVVQGIINNRSRMSTMTDKDRRSFIEDLSSDS